VSRWAVAVLIGLERYASILVLLGKTSQQLIEVHHMWRRKAQSKPRTCKPSRSSWWSDLPRRQSSCLDYKSARFARPDEVAIDLL